MQNDNAPEPSRFSCLCCGSKQARLFLANCRDYYMRKPGLFSYYTCVNCSLVQLHPIPADLGAFYDAYQVHTKKSWLHEFMRRLVMTRGYYFPSPQTGKLRLLDFGCGDGWYLQEMTAQGHKAVGFETNPAHARQLSKNLHLPVLSNIDELERQYEGSLDVVTMHFVVEHLTELLGTFRLAQQLLKPHGLLYFTIPNIGSREFKLFGRKWHGLDPPRHISFLTPRLIETLATKTGFVVRDVQRFGLPNDIAGSLSITLVGHYDYRVFCMCILPALFYCYSFAEGNLRVMLVKELPKQTTSDV